MSSPTFADQALPPIDPQFGLIFAAADHLIPLFQSGSIDVPLAREMAVSAIDAYNPETRADYVNVARTIAFSMAALSLLGQAASRDIPMPEKIRALGRANALNRSAEQSERTMMQRRRYQQANARSEPAELEANLPEHDSQIADAEMQASIADAMNAYRAARAPAGTETVTPAPAPQPITPQPTTSRTITTQPPAVAPAAAIRYNGPKSDTAQPRNLSHKAGLPRHSAMPRVVEQGGAPHAR
jgi:hypothetical protein